MEHQIAADVEHQIAALAARQYGHVTRAQLLELGLGPRAVAYRVEVGKLHIAHQGVYGVGHLPRQAIARAAAAVLACGPGAALSHGSAASLWGLTRHWEFPLEVTAPAERRRPGITTHRSRTLLRADIRNHLGVRTTSPARTVLDIAPRLTDRALTRTVNDARHRGRLHVNAITELMDRCPTHPGAKRLRAVIEAPAGPTRSEFEDAFVALARRHRLPTPQVNVHLNGYEIDALFPRGRLIVELDGWEFHSDRSAFEDDRERDATMLARGYETVRITWERLQDDPEREAARLRRILDARR